MLITLSQLIKSQEDIMKLGKLLKMHRLNNDLTNEEFAKELGINQSTLSRIENSKEVNLVTLIKLLGWLVSD